MALEEVRWRLMVGRRTAALEETWTAWRELEAIVARVLERGMELMRADEEILRLRDLQRQARAR